MLFVMFDRDAKDGDLWRACLIGIEDSQTSEGLMSMFELYVPW